jgi:hypothetical protein
MAAKKKTFRWATIEDALREIRQAYNKMSVAETEFVRICMELEDDHPHLWHPLRNAKDATFGQFLFRVEVCGAEFYDSRAAALRDPLVGQHVDEVGIFAARRLAEVQDPLTKRRALQSMLTFAEDNEKTVPDRTVRTLLKDAQVGPKVRASRLASLAATNRELAAQLKQARARIAELEKENLELREQLGGSRTSTTKKRKVAPAVGSHSSGRSQRTAQA